MRVTDLTNICQAIFSLSKHFVEHFKNKIKCFEDRWRTSSIVKKKWKNTDTLFMNNARA